MSAINKKILVVITRESDCDGDVDKEEKKVKLYFFTAYNIPFFSSGWKETGHAAVNSVSCQNVEKRLGEKISEYPLEIRTKIIQYVKDSFYHKVCCESMVYLW